MNHYPTSTGDSCSDCGTALEGHNHDHEGRCPTCFDRHLFDLDVGFLESYRKFGCRSRLVVAETCLRGLVLDTPEHRKVLAMTIMEQYVLAMSDLAGLFHAFRNRVDAPILKSFLEFKLDATSAYDFFQSVHMLSDVELCAALDLPMPHEVPYRYEHLDEEDARELSIAVYHLVQDLRKATDQDSALALAQFAGHGGAMVMANDTSWLEGPDVTPDQVAMLVLDSRRRSLVVQGLTADEGSMGKVVDAIDTVTRAGSNLIYAYLQANDL